MNGMDATEGLASYLALDGRRLLGPVRPRRRLQGCRPSPLRQWPSDH